MIKKIRRAKKTIKKLSKLVAQFEKLVIRLVSIVGWIDILAHIIIHLFH